MSTNHHECCKLDVNEIEALLRQHFNKFHKSFENLVLEHNQLKESFDDLFKENVELERKIQGTCEFIELCDVNEDGYANYETRQIASRLIDGNITDEDEEEYEYEYENCATEKEPRFGEISYLVAGGGMMNGNACATIELKKGIYYYCEYGKNESRQAVGNKIMWSDEIYDKKNPYECRHFDIIDV